MTSASDSKKPTVQPGSAEYEADEHMTLEALAPVRLPVVRQSWHATPRTRARSLVPRGRTRDLDWRAVASVLAERSGLLVALLDPDGIICSISESLRRMFGWGLADVERRSWVEVYVPADRQAHCRATFDQMLRGALNEGSCELASRDGIRYTARFSAAIVGRGRRQATLLMLEDVTPVQRTNLADQDLDYRVNANAVDFGRLENIGGTTFDGSARSFRCFEIVARRETPCEDCPLLQTQGAWPRTVVRRRERGGFEVISAKPASKQSIDVTRRVVSEPMLAAIHGARIDALAVKGGLTARERDVLQYLMLGRAPEDIATILGLSPRTVKFHQGNVLEKLGADSRLDLMRLLGF